MFAQIRSAGLQPPAPVSNATSLSPLAMQLILPLHRQQDPVMIRRSLLRSVVVSTMGSGYVRSMHELLTKMNHDILWHFCATGSPKPRTKQGKASADLRLAGFHPLPKLRDSRSSRDQLLWLLEATMRRPPCSASKDLSPT